MEGLSTNVLHNYALVHLPTRSKVPDAVLCYFYVVVLKVSGWKEDDDGEGGESGTVFEDVDLTEKEWADYDERSSVDLYDCDRDMMTDGCDERLSTSSFMTTSPVSDQMNRLSSRRSGSALSQ